MTRTVPGSAFVLFVAAALAPGTPAQIIVWGPTAPTVGPSDVSVYGTLVAAHHLHTAGTATANGVPFTGSFMPTGWGGFVSNALSGSTTGDAGYDALLNGARATSAPTGNPTGWGAIRLDTLAALTVGRAYEIQCWYSDQRLGSATNVIHDRVMTLSSAVGPAVLSGGEVTNLSALVQGPLSGPLEADPDDSPALGGTDAVFGMWCIGWFVWVNPTDELHLLVQGSHPVATNVLRPHLNAFQIRELPLGTLYATRTTYGVGCGGASPLALTAAQRPIVNTTVQLTTANVTPATPFGAVALGLNRLQPPVDLTGLGMPGCSQYHDMLAVLLYLPAGATSVVTPLTVPNLVGLQLQAQSFNYDPAAGLTPLGAVASNGLELLCGDF